MDGIRADIDAVVLRALERQGVTGADDDVVIAWATEADRDLRVLVELCFDRQSGAECLSDAEIMAGLEGRLEAR